jgi:hypothetical protein
MKATINDPKQCAALTDDGARCMQRGWTVVKLRGPEHADAIPDWLYFRVCDRHCTERSRVHSAAMPVTEIRVRVTEIG